MKINSIIKVEKKEIKLIECKIANILVVLVYGFHNLTDKQQDKRLIETAKVIQPLNLIGNKEITLDVDSLEQQLISCIMKFDSSELQGIPTNFLPKTLDLVFIRKNIELFMPFVKFIAQALKAQEKSIIVEITGE